MKKHAVDGQQIVQRMSSRKVVFWAIVRFILGIVQIAGATAALIIFAQIGLQPLAIWVCVTALSFTVLSIFLFRTLKVHERNFFDFISMKKCGAEFVGTFALVFAGTGAIIIDETSGGAVTHVGIALTFGLIVLAMIYAVGDISGAHLNPAVSLGFFAARRFPLREVIPYIASQCVGAFVASGLLRFLFPTNATLGATLPAGSATQSFILELILTAILMFVILSVSTGAAEKGITAGIAVGSVIGLEAMFAGPVCGASMNPARSLAPAVVSQHIANLWIYLVAPVAGALLAVVGCRCLREEGCCSISIPGTTSPR
jgi:aquaporin NIP